MSQTDFDSLRERIRLLDLELVARVAERVELARQMGELKRRQSLPTVDYAQETMVLSRARSAAQEHGLDPASPKTSLQASSQPRFPRKRRTVCALRPSAQERLLW